MGTPDPIRKKPHNSLHNDWTENSCLVIAFLRLEVTPKLSSYLTITYFSSDLWTRFRFLLLAVVVVVTMMMVATQNRVESLVIHSLPLCSASFNL